MDRKQVMSVLSEGMQISGVGQASAAALYGYMDTRLHIIELQDKLADTQKMRDKLDLQAIKDGPVLTNDSDNPIDQLSTLCYEMLREHGPLKFNALFDVLGHHKRGKKLLADVAYPSARVQAALKRHQGIKRVGLGVYGTIG